MDVENVMVVETPKGDGKRSAKPTMSPDDGDSPVKSPPKKLTRFSDQSGVHWFNPKDPPSQEKPPRGGAIPAQVGTWPF